MYIGAPMVVIQITHTILAEHVDRYIEATLANAEETRKESGNIRFDLLRDASDPCKFFSCMKSMKAVKRSKFISPLNTLLPGKKPFKGSLPDAHSPSLRLCMSRRLS